MPLTDARNTETNESPADAFARKMAPLIEDFRAAGIISFRQIADELNAIECPTPRNKKWYGSQVNRLILRIKDLPLQPSANTKKQHLKNKNTYSFAYSMSSIIKEIQNLCVKSPDAIAKELNLRDIYTLTGSAWNSSQVEKLLITLRDLNKINKAV